MTSDYTVFTGAIIAEPSSGEKGVGFKIMCKELRDAYKIFVPANNVKNENQLKIGDPIKFHYKGMYVSGNEVRLNVANVFLDNGKS